MLPTTAIAGNREDVLEKLNSGASTEGPEGTKSWHIFFDACLQLSPAPHEVGESFNMGMVWPGMADWSTVSAWASNNVHMEEMLLLNLQHERSLVCHMVLNMSQMAYQSAGIVAEVGVDGSLQHFNF